MQTSVSRPRKIAVFLVVLVVGFAAFAAPAIFFQMGGGGGYQGSNFAILGIVQLLLAVGVVLAGLRMLGEKPRWIGLTTAHWRRDAVLGLAVGLGWAALQFFVLFPMTGGTERADIAGILEMVDGAWVNVLWYLPLGVLGGAVAEEIYNRGFIITALEDLLGGARWATVAAAAFSVLFFAAGHLPSGLVDWIDILIPSTLYAILFLKTRRLTAAIVAHAVWNSLAVSGIHLLYG